MLKGNGHNEGSAADGKVEGGGKGGGNGLEQVSVCALKFGCDARAERRRLPGFVGLDKEAGTARAILWNQWFICGRWMMRDGEEVSFVYEVLDG